MYEAPTQNQRARDRKDFYGKNVCLSVPYHKLRSIDKMDYIVQAEGWTSRSEMIIGLTDKRYASLIDNPKSANKNAWSR